MVQIPPAINNLPVCKGVKPNRFCAKTGKTNTEPYKPNPKIKEVNIPIEKLRFFMILRFTIGWSVLSSRQMNNSNPKTEATANAVMYGVENQSSLSPFSNKVCKLPTAIANNPIPYQSTGLPFQSFGVSRINVMVQ